MKKSSNFLNISLFALLILIGSILEVHSHTALASFDNQVEETTKEIENLADSIFPDIIKIVPFLFYVKLPSALVLVQEVSGLASNISQLLCSYHIALPPPLLELI